MAADGADGRQAARRTLRLAPGLDIFDVGQELAVVTPTTTLRLEGDVADIVRDRLVPMVAKGTSRAALLAGLADQPLHDIVRLVTQLLDAGVIVEEVAEGPPVPAWTHLLTSSAEEREATAARAGSVRIAVIGLWQAGHSFVEALASAGIGTVVIADPFQPYADEFGMAPSGNTPREDVVAGLLADRWPTTEVRVAGLPLTQESVAGLVRDSQLTVTMVAPELSAVRVWANRASLEYGVPSLHVSLRGTRAEIGPLVFPGEGPCYLCWRMRALACEDDFSVAMAREEALDALRWPAEEPRPVLPTLTPWVAGVLGHEALASALGVTQPHLAGQVLMIDGLALTARRHPVVPRPDCPECIKKNGRSRDPTPRTLSDLLNQAPQPTPFDVITADAVSPLCGLIRHLDRVPKDIDEPERPVVVRAELANARFLEGPGGFVTCSGKGESFTTARNGAVAEALERHAALTWSAERRVSEARGDLSGPSLDPRDLVLYAEHQYGELPYAPYTESTVLEWIPACSLVTGEEVWVPLSSAHLGYDVPHRSAYLFPATSNGFAAGSALRDAVLRALLEVVERDAFLIAWSHRLAGVRSDARTIPDDGIQAVAEAYARRGVDLDVYRLPVDTAVSVVLAAGWSPERPAVVIGLGADLDPVRAARQAVMEVAQVRPALRARLLQPATTARLAELASDPSSVSTLEDHDLLYADHDVTSTELAFLLEAPSEPWETPAVEEMSDGAALERVVGSLSRVVDDVLYVDVTPDDVGRLGLRVARAIIPGFQPIHFGAAETRLGGSRLYRMPADLGLRPQTARLHELNLVPHPLA